MRFPLENQDKRDDRARPHTRALTHETALHGDGHRALHLTPAPPAPPRHVIPLILRRRPPPLPCRPAAGVPPRGRGSDGLRGPRLHQWRHPHCFEERRGPRVREGVLPLGCRRRAGEELRRCSPHFCCIWVRLIAWSINGSGLVAVLSPEWSD